MSEVGRNDPCPCGSGKKYKKCCLVKGYIEVGREDSIRKRMVDNLLEFFRKNYGDTIQEAHEIFWDDFLPEQHLEGHHLEIAYQNFFEWITFDFLIEPDGKKILIDLYMEQKQRLSEDERRVLIKLKNAVISLYEVQEVFPDKGLLLKDLLMGGEYDVKEKAATRSLKKWDILAARLLLIDGRYVMSGSIFPYHIAQKQKILDDILKEYEEDRKVFPDEAMDSFLKESGEIFNYYWYSPIMNPPPLPKLYTTTGEPVLLSKALFEIKDSETVRAALSKTKGFEQENNDFIWYDKRKEGSATVLGRVVIRNDRLTLECNSKKRLERGKKLILKAAGDAVIHKVDSLQDPREALKDYEKSPAAPKNEIPIEVQQQLYTQFMQKHYEKWFREKIPALDGKTPLEAIKTEGGKKKVIDLLKLYENGEERNRQEGRPYYDISWIWQKLGIKRD